MIKLSKVQAKVIDKMRSGWEIGVEPYGRGSSSWLQQGKVGYGGKSINISSATVQALHKKGIIYVAIEKFPTRVYRLKTKYK